MNKLIRVTQTINGNEPAMGLYEYHGQAPDNSGFHRYQVIAVIRDGEVAEWRRDMGPASNYKGVKQLIIPSELEHTVDELMDLAYWLRTETDIDVNDWLELAKYKIT